MGKLEDGIVRYTAKMPESVRRRLKVYCTLTGQNMEVLGAQWIAERLAQEERKLPK